ncbi:MAG TPA: phosphoribosylanthranilate isomerase [Bacteroidales bacterium]|nr:phosphoribosylanthranilate isomerase [Bacteroidales bacterium]
MKIKICGLRDRHNIHEVVTLKPDLIGFIFYPVSPRFAGDVLKPADLSGLPASPKKAGVFVNADLYDLNGIFWKYNLDYVQLHGDESPAYCEQLYNSGIRVIKAFRIEKDFDFSGLQAYIPYTTYFLFDAPTEKYGGSGKRFDWNTLASYNLGQPFFLGGGIGAEDAEEILSLRHASLAGIDLNSKFETGPGLKDMQKLKRFLTKLKHI